MHRFYLSEIPAVEETALLPDGEAKHATKVLRMQEGDHCGLLDGNGTLATAEFVSVSKRNVTCRILTREQIPQTTPSMRLYIAPPKGKNMDLLLKMSTELGVSRITPILCHYGVAKPDEAKESWKEILLAACKQSGNPWIPVLDAPIAFANALEASREQGYVGAVPTPQWKRNLTSTDDAPYSSNALALWVGPEGGFTPEEEQMLIDRGTRPITLGKWILRVETAVPALLGALLNQEQPKTEK